MNKTASAILGCMTALLLFSTTANANLIENGGFENPENVNDWTAYTSVPGWEGSKVEIWKSGFNNVVSYEGVQHAELNSEGSAPFTIYQEFSTEIGQTYQVDFAYRARDNSEESFLFGIVEDINDIGNGDLFNDHVVGTWSTFTGTFTANSSTSYIFFKSVSPDGTVGNFIDGVSVSAVPVPAAFWLFGSALVGLVSFGRRSK